MQSKITVKSSIASLDFLLIVRLVPRPIRNPLGLSMSHISVLSQCNHLAMLVNQPIIIRPNLSEHLVPIQTKYKLRLSLYRIVPRNLARNIAIDLDDLKRTLLGRKLVNVLIG